MPRPTLEDVHVDALLSNVSTAYIQDDNHFISTQAFPAVSVNKKSDLFRTYDKGDFLRTESKVLGPGATANERGYDISTDTYDATPKAIAKFIGDMEMANNDVDDLMEIATMLLTKDLLMDKEADWMTSFFSASVWDTDVTPANLWDTGTSADILGDVSTGKQTILANTGFEPNTLVLDYRVFEEIRQNADVKDQFKYTSSRSLSVDMLAGYLDVERILIAKGVRNSANVGAADSVDFISGKHALLCYVPSVASTMSPSAGYTFSWSGWGPVGTGLEVRQIREDKRRGTTVDVAWAYDHKLVGSDLGYFFENVIS